MILCCSRNNTRKLNSLNLNLYEAQLDRRLMPEKMKAEML